MPTPEDTSQAPDHGAAAGGWRAFWKKYRSWVGAVLTSIVVIPLGTWAVGSAQHWFSRNFEEYLSAVVSVPSPARVCEGGQGWVFDKDPQQLPGLPMNGGDIEAWAKANGGIPASDNYIEVTLHALNGHKVTVPRDGGISVEIKSRTDPPHGTYPSLTGGCGGILPYRFALNLDTKPVSVTAKPDEGAVPGVPRLVDLPHEIGSEAEVWHLAAVTQTCTCEWTATLHWIAEDGTEGTTPLNDKHPFFRVAAVTRAIEDVQAAYDWLLQKGYQPDKIASVGHSVGGNLAISLGLRLRDNGAALPGALLSISPWVDLAMTNETITNNAERDKLLSRPLLEFFRSAWLDGTGVDWQDPRVNLLAADLAGLPPIAVYYGTDELLAGEAAELARRAQAAGNDVIVRAVHAGQHSFIIGAGRVPEVDDAVAEMGAWLRSRLGLAVLQDTAK